MLNKNTTTVPVPDIIGILLLSFLSPCLGLVIMLFKVLKDSTCSKNSLILFIIALSFFLSYLNSTKIASSDTIHYLEWYEQVNRADPIHSLLYYRGDYSLSEPFFAVLSIVFNYMTLGSSSGYLFLCTFFIYSIQFWAICLVCKKFKVSRKVTILLVLLLAFYNPLFLQTIHGLRQMMATAILMLAIARRVYTEKNSWILLLLAFLTHTSVLAYFPMVIFSITYQKLSWYRALIISVISFALIYSYMSVGILFQASSIDYLGEVGAKIVDVSNHNQMDLALRGFYMYNIPFLLVTIISIISCKKEHGEMTVYHLLYLITCIIVISNPISTEVSVRYAFFVCSFFPYCFLALELTNNRLSKTILQPITIIVVLIFFYLLAGDPQFPSLMTLIFKPFPLFW